MFSQSYSGDDISIRFLDDESFVYWEGKGGDRLMEDYVGEGVWGETQNGVVLGKISGYGGGNAKCGVIYFAVKEV